MLPVMESKGATRAFTCACLNGETCADTGKQSSWVLAHPWIQQVDNAGESRSPLCYSNKYARCKTRN